MMKNSNAISIVVISIIVIIIITTFADASTYVSFSEAKSMHNAGNTSKIHVVGKLNKNGKNEIEGLNNSENRLSFSFDMIDEKGKKENVFYGEPMPPDFLLSEQIVVIGSYDSERFVANEILLKCPSKYTENNIKM